MSSWEGVASPDGWLYRSIKESILLHEPRLQDVGNGGDRGVASVLPVVAELFLMISGAILSDQSSKCSVDHRENTYPVASSGCLFLMR